MTSLQSEVSAEPLPADRDAPARHALLISLQSEMDRVASKDAQLNDLVADRTGIAGSDLFCLKLVLSRGGVTAGELTAATGLTTGAITGVMNRLEARQLARRDSDPNDRRRTIVRPRSQATRRIAPIFEALNEAVRDKLSGYSDDELQIARDIIARCADAADEQASRFAAKPGRRHRS